MILKTNEYLKPTISLLIAVLLVFVSCLHSSYENVRLIKQADSVFFYPDQNAPREPMPLNISALLAHSGGRWGVLYYVPYRETGLSAINRTIITCALYMAVIDEDLNRFTEKPALVYREEGNYTVDFAGTDEGLYVSYVTRDNRIVCLEYEAACPERAKHKYEISDAGGVVSAGGSYSAMPLAVYRKELYALAVKNGLGIIRIARDGSRTDLPLFHGSGKKSVIKSADLLVDESGIHAGWAEMEQGKGGTASFFYSFCDHQTKKIDTRQIPVKGDSPHTLNVVLVKMNSRVVMMVQYGNEMWMVKSTGGPSIKAHAEKLSVIGTGKYPPVAGCACSDDECLVIFHKVDGAYIYSSRSGLKRSTSPGYIKRTYCHGAKCIQFNSEKGIVPLE